MVKPSLSNTKQLGELTEQIVITELMKKGFVVLKPIGDNQRYDIVVNIFGGFKRIQIKTARYMNKVIKIMTANSQCTMKKRRIKKYTKEQIDSFIGYCYETEKMYYIPIDKAPSREITLRINQTKNKQNKNIHYAKDFEL